MRRKREKRSSNGKSYTEPEKFVRVALNPTKTAIECGTDDGAKYVLPAGCMAGCET